MADPEVVPAVTPPAIPGILEQVKSRVAGAVQSTVNTANTVGGMIKNRYDSRPTTKLQINTTDAAVPEILDAAGGAVTPPVFATPETPTATAQITPNRTVDPVAAQRYMVQRQQAIDAAKAAAAMPKAKQTSYGDPF